MDTMSLDKLTRLGFRHALTMTWAGGGPGTFKIVPLNEDILRVRSVIYAWYDRHNDVIMNVGLTSQTLKARFLNAAGYEHWLNASRKDRIDRPIRHRWLDHIKSSKSGLIEVHIRPCDEGLLNQEENRFMNELNPVLNVRR